MQRATGKIVDRRGNPIGSLSMTGKSKKSAFSRLKTYARKLGINVLDRSQKRNVEEGFWTGRGRHRVFHPIRSSSDYDPSRVGEKRGAGKRAYAKRTARRARRGRHGSVT